MGSIGQRHAENARKLGHQVVSYDPAAPSDYRFERYLYDDKSVDAIVVATPSMWHEGPLRAAIERGKHVLIEKPISVAEGMLRQLLTEAAYKQLTVMMGNNLRFHPSVIRAKQYVDSGALGSPRWANFICATEWTSTAARDGVILNTGSHEVDIALYLFGPAVALTAVAEGRIMVGGADVGPDISTDFVLQHDSGVRSTFHLDIDTTDRVRQFWISGTEKSVQFDLDIRTVYSHADKGTYLGGSYADDYHTEMMAFVDRIEGGARKLGGATGEEGLDCLRTLLDIRKKAGL
jgi:predicted dehydrogenase